MMRSLNTARFCSGTRLFISFIVAVILFHWWFQIGPLFGEEEIHDTQFLNNSAISQDDPHLVRAVRNLIFRPSTLLYNFTDEKLASKELNINPSAGQVQAVEDILRGFGEGKELFYVDCGANDGEWHSNSIFLERSLGWDGVLIEADPNVFDKLVQKRRKAHLAHFCLSTIPHPTIMPFYLDKKHKSSLGGGLIKSKVYAAVNSIAVQCVPLYSILLALNRPTVDFFSLDIEGSEIDVLMTIPFDKVIFKVITIEHSVLKMGKVGLRKFMEERGYIFYRTVVDSQFISGDSIFIHNSVPLTQTQQLNIGIEDSNLTRTARI